MTDWDPATKFLLDDTLHLTQETSGAPTGLKYLQFFFFTPQEINKKTEELRLMYEKSKSYFNLKDKNKHDDDRSWITRIFGQSHDSHLKAKAEEVEKLRATMSADRENLQASEQALKDSKDQYNKRKNQ